MRRLLRAAVVVLAFGQVTGLWAELGGELCEIDCEDDAQGKSCPPSCTTCSCPMRAASPLIVARAVVAAPVPLVSRVARPARESLPASPDPSEILHVPRSPVA